jgi:hypothetical protein
MALQPRLRLAVAGSASVSQEMQRHSAARLSHGNRAVGIVLDNRNGQPQELMPEPDRAVFGRNPAPVILSARLITAVTISLGRSVRTSLDRGRRRVRLDTAAAIAMDLVKAMALAQAMPRQVSAG